MEQDTIETMSTGQILAAARQRCDKSVEAIAQSLNLSPSVIKAIEADHFERFDSLTYLRGYLRAYAKLVHLNEDEFIQMFSQVKAPDFSDDPVIAQISKPPVFKFNRSAKFNRRFISRMMCLLLVILIGYAVVSHFYSHQVNVEAQTLISGVHPVTSALPIASSTSVALKVHKKHLSLKPRPHHHRLTVHREKS